MPDDDVADQADVIDDDTADHDVPVDLTLAHEAIDYAERVALGPNPS